ncbi:CGNR zinc finger domain-containing protein [Burkholderia cenocepacia]|uniref:CGNR zinc finger domain-containing protein n=1 Tax=Burkholderia cenocepacia TaxID=95486 RepID=UPI002860685A|nr:ABATE domain-containing protein [Burkholderia cenocepacia]MDR5644415.1 CGNR zinc finger domain-containing protein [Burkholderia cenocepacia]
MVQGGLESEFRFNSGRLSLDLAATVRRRASTPNDVLRTAGACGRWLKAAALFADVPSLSPVETDALLSLREAIWSLVSGSLHGALAQDSVAVVNAAARYPLATPQLDACTGVVSVASADPFATALSVIARDAIDLVSGPLRHRVKECDQPDCRMLFIDTSPTGRRRWCSMQRCGSRAKVRAFKNRQEQALAE